MVSFKVKPRRSINFRAYFRAVVAIALIVCWSLAAISGFLMHFAPRGQGLGRLPWLLGLNRHQWGEFHFTISVVALCITIIHVVIDWRVLIGLLRYLVSVRRRRDLLD